MLASDVWIEKLALLSHEDAYNSVDPLSSEDVAVVVDFHWFTDCHLEAIFYTRHDFDLISDHRRRERCSSDHRRFSLNPAQHDILPHRQSQLSDLTIRLHTTTSLNLRTQVKHLIVRIYLSKLNTKLYVTYYSY